MLKRILALDGVQAVARFRDDGALFEAYGTLSESHMVTLARFARDYKRLMQANADQLAMFTGMRGWTPPSAWVVRGQNMTVCSAGNLVCIVENNLSNANEIMQTLTELAQY